MDPITTAIVAALTAGAAAGITDTAKSMISDAYQSLKDLLKKKFGDQSDIAKSVDALESKPDSTGRQTTLAEEITTAKAQQDQEILKAAQHLLQQINTQPGGERHVQHVVGNYNAVVQGTGNPTVNVNTSDKP